MTKNTIRNIGIPVKKLKEIPVENERNNPFNGSLSVRGKIFEGIVIKAKAKGTVVIQKESPIFLTKFKRYGRSKNRIHAHVPSNITVNEGDHVMAAECRPISKSVSFVIVEVKQ
jgi:small subunit ribosomal protein S17